MLWFRFWRRKPKLHDSCFHYRGLRNCACKCRIRWVLHEDKVVVILTELADNQGTSITNWAEWLAAEICRHFHFNPAQVIWIHHYQDHGSSGRGFPKLPLEEHFDLMRFDLNDFVFSNPRWGYISKQDVEKMIGQRLSSK